MKIQKNMHKISSHVYSYKVFRKMELHTCKLLEFVVDDQLEPSAAINHEAVVEHVVE